MGTLRWSWSSCAAGRVDWGLLQRWPGSFPGRFWRSCGTHPRVRPPSGKKQRCQRDRKQGPRQVLMQCCVGPGSSTDHTRQPGSVRVAAQAPAVGVELVRLVPILFCDPQCCSAPSLPFGFGSCSASLQPLPFTLVAWVPKLGSQEDPAPPCLHCGRARSTVCSFEFVHVTGTKNAPEFRKGRSALTDALTSNTSACHATQPHVARV